MNCRIWRKPNRFDRGALGPQIEHYATAAEIDEVWQQPFDPLLWYDDFELWEAQVETRPTEVLELIGQMPHPVFMRHCFRSERWARQPDAIGRLIHAAPSAFDDQGTFRAGGAVVVLLLEMAGTAIAQTALDDEGALCIVPADQTELLGPAITLCQATLKTLLDALFSRPDAVPLTWAWLEHLVFERKLRSRRSPHGTGIALNVPMLSIRALAERLSWRDDGRQWITERPRMKRIYRLAAVMAVGMFGQAPDSERLASELIWALTAGDLNYTGVTDAMARTDDVVAALGGHAIGRLANPSAWFAATWQKLRPIRERNWRAAGGKHNYVGELLLLWGLTACELLPQQERKALWISAEQSLRDAWQTDRLLLSPVWEQALVRLFSGLAFDKDEDGRWSEQQAAAALLPYMAADYEFLRLRQTSAC